MSILTLFEALPEYLQPIVREVEHRVQAKWPSTEPEKNDLRTWADSVAEQSGASLDERQVLLGAVNKVIYDYSPPGSSDIAKALSAVQGLGSWVLYALLLVAIIYVARTFR